MGKVTHRGKMFLFWDNENVLKTDCGDGCTTKLNTLMGELYVKKPVILKKRK